MTFVYVLAAIGAFFLLSMVLCFTWILILEGFRNSAGDVRASRRATHRR